MYLQTQDPFTLKKALVTTSHAPFLAIHALLFFQTALIWQSLTDVFACWSQAHVHVFRSLDKILSAPISR